MREEINDLADRPARALADGELLRIGQKTLRRIDAPHVPHGWDSGFMMETETRTLFSGDLFTQGGNGHKPLTEGDILGPSEAFRAQMDYYAHAPQTDAILERLTRDQPGAGVHARQRVARRWSGLAAGAGEVSARQAVDCCCLREFDMRRGPEREACFGTSPRLRG